MNRVGAIVFREIREVIPPFIFFFLLFAPAAAAGPVANLSRTLVGFGNTPGLVHITHPVFITNTGDAPLNISVLSMSGDNAADFILGGTCIAPITLPVGGGRCRIDITSNLADSGRIGRTAALTVQSDASPPIATVSVFATLDNVAPTTILTPTWIDFPPQAMGTSAQGQTFTFTNQTDVLFRLDRALFYGGDGADFAVTTDCANLSPGASCTLTIGFVPTATGPRSTELEIDYSTFDSSPPTMRVRLYSVTGVGGNATAINYQGLFYAAPAESESGWGLNLAHQADTIFATWFTYDTTGKEWWLSMTANKTGSNPDSYSGQLIQTHGPAFSAVPFDPTLVTRSVVGTGTLSFSDANNGSFTYSVTTADELTKALTQQTKALTRQVFGPLPACSFSLLANPAATTNYTALWWASPPGAQAGWGINLTHQGSTIFVTWFTYDVDATPLWLSATLVKGAGEVFSGALIKTAGPAFNAVPFDPTKVTRTTAGNATLTFSDGNTARFDYTVNAVTQSKMITRQLFNPPAGTVCH